MTAAPLQHPLPVPAARAGRWLVVLTAFILLTGALITPWGLARSHGSAEVSALQHSSAWDIHEGHGHSHEDDLPVSLGVHAHHAADHSHDHAHALPTDWPRLHEAAVVWASGPDHAGPWPSLAPLERPPRS